MEAWLAELEREIDPVGTLTNNPYHQCDQGENSMAAASFSEQIAATLGEDFPYLFSSAESQTGSPQWDIDSILVEQVTSPDHENNNYNNNNNNNGNDKKESEQITKNKEKHETKTNKQVTSGGAKRKRQPNQVQDHILAERKRRELLSQLFISLSALVPGLKKMDKTSVLGEAIRYMKQLKENVKVLEEMVAKRTVESMVVVKKTKLILDNDGSDDNDSSSTVDDNCGSANCGGNGGDGGGGGGGELDNNFVNDSSLPEIEVKISGDSLLLKIHCENHVGILAKLFAELEKYDLNIINSSASSFGSLALDITIVAQIQGDFNKNVRTFVRTLRSALLLANRQNSFVTPSTSNV